MRRARTRGLSRVQAGIVLLVAVVVISYLGFTKAIPFRHHYEIKADFKTSNNLRVASLVRIAGVNVGKVTAVEPLRKGTPGVRVTMRIDDVGRPIHKDATVQLRERIFLEGNLFVNLIPGTPTAPILGDGDVIPAGQTTTPVQLDQVLTALQADTRNDLVRLLAELSTGLSGKGGIGYNRAVQYWLPAFKNSAIVNDATLGSAPHDLSRYLAAQGTFAAALDRNPPALKSLITNFNITAHAFAREQAALKSTLTELPRTLRAASPALLSLNSSFPPLRRLTADLRPGVRSTGPAIDASLPFIAQLRGLVQPQELQGLTADLRQIVPDLSKLNHELPGFYRQVRLASSCQNEVILPWSHEKTGDPVFQSKGEVYQEGVKNLPGLAAESRSGDANGQWARTLAGNGTFTYLLSLTGNPLNRFGLTNFPLQGSNPPKMNIPPFRYDIPCETQEVPDLNSKPGPPLKLVNFLQNHVTLPFARLGQAQEMEGLAQLLDQGGKHAAATKMRAQAKDVRKRYHLEGKRFKQVGDTVKIAGGDSTGEQGAKNGKGKDTDGKGKAGKGKGGLLGLGGVTNVGQDGGP